MAITRAFKDTVIERVKKDPKFAQALLSEAVESFINNETETARLILRDLVNATVGFEKLAVLTDKNSKTLHRMLSANGNPSMDNLATIFGAVQKKLNLGIKVSSASISKSRSYARA
jgi:DNA-binding phage protein